MIFTFYSYKGGVGRTMALANVAELCCQAGLRVLMIDWDLEAPGLERFFPSLGTRGAQDRRGLIDMLLNYKQQMALDIKEGESLDLESPWHYIVPVPREENDDGSLFLLTAGRRSQAHFSDYARAVVTFDWQDFYKSWGGELYINWLREEVESKADIILIDSRTGVTEMGGVCTHHLADIVVMFCAPHQQNIDGIHRMAQTLRDPMLQGARRGRSLETMVIPARIERAESDLLDQFHNEFVELFADVVPRTKEIDIGYLWDSRIPYIPKYAYRELVAVREHGKASAEDMAKAYHNLGQAMGRLSGLEIGSTASKRARPTPSKKMISWLHLSDLHMPSDAPADLRMVLDSMWRDIPSQIERVGGRLDFIAFTGDVAHSGRHEEYLMAEEHFFRPLLDMTGLPVSRLFIVPGNHDVDPELVDLINPDIRWGLTNREEVNALFKDAGRRRILFHSMTNYGEFITRLYSDVPGHPLLRDPLFSYAQPLGVGVPAVAVIGLNSAWLSGFGESPDGLLSDYGNLVIGDKQMSDAIGSARGATIRFLLMHHPLSWLSEFDRADFRYRLRAAGDIVLLGHNHDSDFGVNKRLGSGELTISSGSVAPRREWPVGYNLATLDLDTGKGLLVLRRYDNARRAWLPDYASTGDETAGTFTFDLRGGIGQPSAQTFAPTRASLFDQSIAEVEPTWLLLGRQREAQLLADFIQQQTRGTLWIWGGEGCGSREFLQVARVLLRQQDALVLLLDATESKAPLDLETGLEMLRRCAGADHASPAYRRGESHDEFIGSSIVDIRHRLERSENRPALLFAGFHRMSQDLRDWIRYELWNQLMASYEKHNPVSIVTCEGSPPACPAFDEAHSIYLGDFTQMDVEEYLSTLPSVDPRDISVLVGKIHSGGASEFQAAPERVYANLLEELPFLGRLEE